VFLSALLLFVFLVPSPQGEPALTISKPTLVDDSERLPDRTSAAQRSGTQAATVRPWPPRRLEFDLVNVSSQAIVAWNVRYKLSLTDGRQITRGYGPDGYQVYEGVITDPRPVTVPPKRTLHSFLPLADDVTSNAILERITIVSVIFADGSWWGEEAAVRGVFDRRAREAAAYSVIVGALRAGREAVGGTGSLEVALQRLSDRNQADFDQNIKQMMRKNLQRNIERKADTSRSDGEQLDHYIKQHQALLHAANKHRHMQSPGPQE
jgi:hypothetical protein